METIESEVAKDEGKKSGNSTARPKSDSLRVSVEATDYRGTR